MAKDKRSFFERLTGSVKVDDDSDADIIEPKEKDEEVKRLRLRPSASVNGSARSGGRAVAITAQVQPASENDWLEEQGEEGQLTVDVFQTASDIFIKTIVAGVRPDDLDISISRDMVSIHGRREESKEVSDDDYFHKELYWGGFARTILLPEEIDVEAAEATQNHGLLTIRLPKVDKRRQTKLRVKAVN